MYDVNTGQNNQVAAHDAPIKCVCYSEMPNGSGGTGVLITAGWDKKLKVGLGRLPHQGKTTSSCRDVKRKEGLKSSTGTCDNQIRS